MTLQQRRIFVTLDLYTDAPLEAIIDAQHWVDLLKGKNPSWVQEGREAQIRIQGVECGRDGDAIELAMIEKAKDDVREELEVELTEMATELRTLKDALTQAATSKAPPKAKKAGKKPKAEVAG